jgi:hypothetical protein
MKRAVGQAFGDTTYQAQGHPILLQSFQCRLHARHDQYSVPSLPQQTGQRAAVPLPGLDNQNPLPYARIRLSGALDFLAHLALLPVQPGCQLVPQLV